MTRLLLALAAVACCSCGPVDPSGRAAAVAALTGDATAGQQVFTQSCAPCHGATGQGTASGEALAPSFTSKSAADLALVLLNGEGSMPPQRQLSNQQIADVLAWGKANLK